MVASEAAEKKEEFFVLSNFLKYEKIVIQCHDNPLKENELTCKPGSVENDHLSRPAVAGRLKPPPENGRASLLFSHGVAPDRVYSVHMSPCDG